MLYITPHLLILKIKYKFLSLGACMRTGGSAFKSCDCEPFEAADREKQGTKLKRKQSVVNLDLHSITLVNLHVCPTDLQ